MDDFDRLMQLDQMGETYKLLTSSGQVDPQLLSFVNYDKIDLSLGLEGLDITALHEQTLADIESSQFFELACEGFIDTLKSSLEEIKNFITFNKAKPFSHFLNGNLEQVNSNITVVTYEDMKRILALHAKITQVLGWILDNIPKVKSYDEWRDYHQKKFKTGAQFDIMKARDKVADIRRGIKKIEKRDIFVGSGWKPDRLKESIRAYDADVATMIAQTNKASDLLLSLRVVMTVSKYTKKHKNVISSMKRAVYLVNGAVDVCKTLQNKARSSITQVTRHYKVSE